MLAIAFANNIDSHRLVNTIIHCIITESHYLWWGHPTVDMWFIDNSSCRVKVEQDLSLNCSAWKGFIPCLQWKSLRPKQMLDPKFYLGPLEYYGSENFLCPEQIFEEKNLWLEKIFGLKFFWHWYRQMLPGQMSQWQLVNSIMLV